MRLQYEQNSEKVINSFWVSFAKTLKNKHPEYPMFKSSVSRLWYRNYSSAGDICGVIMFGKVNNREDKGLGDWFADLLDWRETNFGIKPDQYEKLIVDVLSFPVE